MLIEKNKTPTTPRAARSRCFAWIVDAHPEDINIVDFERPDGTSQQVTTGDPRQLTDAAFHAGLNSGSLVRVGGHRATASTSTSSTSTSTRTASSATRSRSRTSTAPVRTTAASQVDEAAGDSIHERYDDVHVPAHQHGRRAAAVGGLHPEDAERVLRRRLPAVGVGRGRRLAGPAVERAGDRPVRWIGRRPGLRDPRPRQRRQRDDRAHRDLGQRPDQDVDRDVRDVGPGADRRRRDARLPRRRPVGRRCDEQARSQRAIAAARREPRARPTGSTPAR